MVYHSGAHIPAQCTGNSRVRIADALVQKLEPGGLAVVMKTEHPRMSMRRVRQQRIISAVHSVPRCSVTSRIEVVKLIKARSQ